MLGLKHFNQRVCFMMRCLIQFDDGREDVIIFECKKSEDPEMIAKMFVDIEDDDVHYTVTKI